MKERFEGETGLRLRVEALLSQKIVAANADLANELADLVEVIEIASGASLIEQNADDNDVYFIFSGRFSVVVNGQKVGVRGPNDHVGEMVAIEPTQRRSASIVCEDTGVVGKISEEGFHSVAQKFPNVYRFVAKELARRLLQRNSLVKSFRDRIRVFIISSAEALPIARAVQNAFQHDDFTTTIWTDGVFRVANYTLQNLEDQIDDSDFAIAIAHSDDLTESRSQTWPSPRDNVIFELGMFMGRLGRARAILMEPRAEKVKLPSDLSGVTTIPYRFQRGEDAAALIAPACNQLRDHIVALGPNN